MMQHLGQYVLSLAAMAMLSGLILPLFQEESMRKCIRMICGILLTVTALMPLKELSLQDMDLIPREYLQTGEVLAAQGQSLAAEEERRCISRQMEAYILDKAEELGAAVMPSVTLDAQSVPVSVRLAGTCGPDIRHALAQIITNDLGIPEEDQKWTGQLQERP